MKILVQKGEKIISSILDKILNSFELIMMNSLANIEKVFVIIFILFIVQQILIKINAKLK